MKKSLIALLVLALVAPTMAATVVDVAGGEKEITVTITVSDDDVVRGVAIAVEQASGDLGNIQLVAGTDVSAPAFNTYIDWAVSNAGGYEIGDGHPAAKIDEAGAIDDVLPASAFAVSAGYLDQSEQQGGLGAGVYTITIALDGTADTYFDVSLDTLRGGIVGDNLEVTDNTTQVLVTAGDTFPTCQDFNLTKKKGGLTDNAVNVADITNLINYINTYKVSPTVFVVPTTSPNYDADYNFDPSSPAINVGDVTAMINWIDANKVSPTVFVVVCP